MDSASLVYRLLARVLLDIRIASVTEEHQPIFHLADFFHTMPYTLMQVASGTCSYADVVGMLQQRADDRGCRQWFEGYLATVLAHATGQVPGDSGDVMH